MIIITKNNGYSLVEVMVAVAVLLLAIIGPMTIAAKGLQSAYYAREQATATFLAQEGIELVVAIRNDKYISAINSAATNADIGDGWDNGFKNDSRIVTCKSGDGCNLVVNNLGIIGASDCGIGGNCKLKYSNTGLIRARYGTNGSDSKYTRVIKLDDVGDHMYITSTVSWPTSLFGGSQTQSVELHSAVSKIYGN